MRSCRGKGKGVDYSVVCCWLEAVDCRWKHMMGGRWGQPSEWTEGCSVGPLV